MVIAYVLEGLNDEIRRRLYDMCRARTADIRWFTHIYSYAHWLHDNERHTHLLILYEETAFIQMLLTEWQRTGRLQHTAVVFIGNNPETIADHLREYMG